MAERTRSRRGAAAGSSRRGRAESASGKLNRDYSDEEYREPSEGYQGEQPTKGLYTAELFDIKDHTTGEGNESVRWGFRLAEGSENKHGDDVSGFPDFIYTTENALWKEQQILVALGIIKPGGKVNLSYDGIIKKAKPCTVKIGLERYVPEDGDPEWRGRMEAFLPLRDSTGPAKSRRAKQDADAEDVFDDDETDDDEDEEETPPARSRRSTTRSRRKAEPEPEEDEEGDEDGLEPEDDEEEGDEDYDPDELAAELADLTLAKLKARARDEFGVKITRGMVADDIIDAVLDTLDDDEPEEDESEDEPEEEPELPKRRGTSRTKTGSASTRRKRGTSKEPPF